MFSKKILLAILAMGSLSFGALSARAEENRSRVIDFEDELVEGVNRKPLDSLNQISEKEKRKRRMHLYRKRGGFKSDNQELLREMRYAQ